MSVDKPYDVQMYPNADAILAVYGCKGSSVDVTEALTGGVTTSEAAYGPNIIAGIEVALGTFKASGKLPVNVPKLNANKNAYTDEIVYARGYGLTYDSKLSKVELNKAIELASNLDESKYTKESWDVLVDALASAKVVANTNGISQAKIDEATKVLNDAIAGLVEVNVVPTPTPDPENPADTVKPDTKPDNSVATGDESNLVMYFSVALITFIGFVVLSNKKAKFIKK